MKKTKPIKRNGLELVIRLTIGVLLALGTIVLFTFAKEMMESDALGWLELLGGSIYILAMLLIAVLIDLLYFVTFLTWYLFGYKKGSDHDRVILP